MVKSESRVLNLLKRSSFLGKNALLDLYFRVILPSVFYGLIVWGGCANAKQLNSLEMLHRRAVRVIYKLPKDMPSSDFYQHTNWDTIDYMYNPLCLIKLFYKIISEEAPPTLCNLVNRPCASYNLRNSNRITVPGTISPLLSEKLSRTQRSHPIEQSFVYASITRGAISRHFSALLRKTLS